MNLLSPIAYLRGLGPQRALLLQKELQISSFGDMLFHFPFRYVDRSRIDQIRYINPNSQFVQLKGILGPFRQMGDKGGRRLSARLEDETGSIELLWFRGLDYISKSLQPGTEYLVFGKPNWFNGNVNLPHPEIEPATLSARINPLQPVYSTTEKLRRIGLDSRGIRKAQEQLHEIIRPEDLPEYLPGLLMHRCRLLPRYEALRQIHFPDTPALAEEARRRLKFEELFLLQLRILRAKTARQELSSGHLFQQVGENFLKLYENHLPFQLTGAQKRVLREIRHDTLSGKQMNRLVQGDVGSGKTVVALLSMLLAIDNGFQACLLAPTEILARQHLQGISDLLKPLGIPVAFLSGQVKGAARKEILHGLAAGTLPILIGTHAILEDPVRFHRLGLAVIDEQHRFGVEQRARLWAKSTPPPHVLVMTATPIPRTLAMTLYGDLDVSVIDELPPGRKPIRTTHATESMRLRVFDFMKEQIALGRQIYVVYPLIEESEKLDLTALQQGLEALERVFPRPQYHISMVHGKMLPANKDIEMARFVKGETQIMVATTVIEVGVNVPNASVMVIEHAERFGLAQLHQLRGRVGRGAEQSYCMLLSGEKLPEYAKKRIEVMCQTQDGFVIAEEDLRLRGPGDIDGTRQSGDLELRLAKLSEDQELLLAARKEAGELVSADPELRHPDHHPLREYLDGLGREGIWSRIS